MESETPLLQREELVSALQRDGLCLRHARENFKADEELVMIAVSQNGNALMFASEGLKKSKAIVTAAVLQYGPSMQYASKHLIEDREFVLELCTKVCLPLWSRLLLVTCRRGQAACRGWMRR